MKHRNPAAVFFLPIITLGIYGIVWEVKTKNEMKALGADIPTAWLLIVPFVNYYWFWKYCKGIELVSNKEMSAAMSFVLLILLGIIGMAIVQTEFNKVAGAQTPRADPIAPTNPLPGGPLPGTSFGGPVAASSPVVSGGPVAPQSFAPSAPSATSMPESPASTSQPFASPQTPAPVVSDPTRPEQPLRPPLAPPPQV